MKAREELARLYWFPLYALARGRGLAPEDASDAVQTFLSRLLTGDCLVNLTRDGGRFRDFLRTGLRNQLISEHRTNTGTRRRPVGGWISRDGFDPEAALALDPPDRSTPELAFDRRCARAMLDAALERLGREYQRLGRAELFTHLSQYLDGEPDGTSHTEAAIRLGLAEGTIRNATKPFRKRFQAQFRQQVARTLADPADVDDEIRLLLAALSA